MTPLKTRRIITEKDLARNWSCTKRRDEESAGCVSCAMEVATGDRYPWGNFREQLSTASGTDGLARLWWNRGVEAFGGQAAFLEMIAGEIAKGDAPGVSYSRENIRSVVVSYLRKMAAGMVGEQPAILEAVARYYFFEGATISELPEHLGDYALTFEWGETVRVDVKNGAQITNAALLAKEVARKPVDHIVGVYDGTLYVYSVTGSGKLNPNAWTAII